MSDNSKKSFVKTFVLGLLGVLFSFSFFKKKKTSLKKEDSQKTVKMLSEDGTLIEIDTKILESMNKRLISKDELQNWVKR